MTSGAALNPPFVAKRREMHLSPIISNQVVLVRRIARAGSIICRVLLTLVRHTHTMAAVFFGMVSMEVVVILTPLLSSSKNRRSDSTQINEIFGSAAVTVIFGKFDMHGKGGRFRRHIPVITCDTKRIHIYTPYTVTRRNTRHARIYLHKTTIQGIIPSVHNGEQGV